jgi:uncharacterized membrane protein YczE
MLKLTQIVQIFMSLLTAYFCYLMLYSNYVHGYDSKLFLLTASSVLFMGCSTQIKIICLTNN